jgi:probable phosphoglycerate mutase
VTTTFFLIRHGSHDLLEKRLVGRSDNVLLSDAGRAEANRLAERLAHESLSVVQSSPRERARDTASPIAERARVPLEITPGIDEIDFGAWMGRTFEDLAGDPRWQEWNATRSTARAPSGESMSQAQSRVVAHISQVRAAYPDRRVALVSHSDIIKAAILHFLGASLDMIGRLEVSPASISTLVVGSWGAKLLSLNETVAT